MIFWGPCQYIGRYTNIICSDPSYVVIKHLLLLIIIIIIIINIILIIIIIIIVTKQMQHWHKISNASINISKVIFI